MRPLINSPLISVIIPVAEAHLKYLPLALDSVHKQTFTDFEIVLMDGGKGTAKARNEGVKQAKGELITFLDADDVLVDTALEALTRTYAESDAHYIYGDWYELSKNNNDLVYQKAAAYDRLKYINQVKYYMHLVTTLMSRELYLDVGGMNEQFPFWEDWYFYAGLAVKGYCGERVPSPILVYRLSSSINREKHNGISNEAYALLRSEFTPYLEGKEPLMACKTCGGGLKAQVRENLPPRQPASQNGMTVMEYTGQREGSMPFRMRDGTSYTFGNNSTNKFVQVKPDHVQEVLARHIAKVAALPSKEPTVPDVAQLNQIPFTPPKSFEEFRKESMRPISMPTPIEVPDNATYITDPTLAR